MTPRPAIGAGAPRASSDPASPAEGTEHGREQVTLSGRDAPSVRQG
jgi:hypothetical protein